MATSDKALEKLQIELKETLEATDLCTVHGVQSKKGDIRVMFSVKNETPWLRILARFLAQADQESWYVFVGKKYVLHEGRLAAPWVLIVDVAEGDTLRNATMGVRRCFTSAYEVINGGPKEPPIVEMSIPWAVPKNFAERVSPTSEHVRPAR